MYSDREHRNTSDTGGKAGRHYVLVPGAWAGDWIWQDTGAILARAGHEVHSLMLPGLEPGDAGVTFANQVDSVVQWLESSAVESVILVGHSYAGLVVGKIAVDSPRRIGHTVFVEAFLPVHDQSLLDVSGLDVAEELALIDAHDGYWPAPTSNELEQQPGLSTDLVELLNDRQRPQPGRTVTDRVTLSGVLADIDATFVAQAGWLESSRESDLLAFLRQQNRWQFFTIDGGHWPMLTMPDRLARILLDVPA